MIAPDLCAATITLDHMGVSENTYSARSLRSEQASPIYNQLVRAFPEVLDDDQSQWELIGVSSDNGDNYRTPTISVFFQGPPSEERKLKFEVPNDLLLVDSHTIKYEPETRKSYLKVYQGDWWNISLPSLPAGAALATNFGLGRHFMKPELSARRDVYFFHNNETVLNAWLGGLGIAPVLDAGLDLGLLGLYGLQFDAETLKPYRIKRYYQPHQPLIVDRLSL